MALIVALHNQTRYPEPSGTVISLICPNPTTADAKSFRFQLLQMPPAFIIGCATMIFMALLRIWCFRTLARFFTFEISILDSHKLIQSGPYAYVRHPAYTAQILLTGGVYLMGFSRGGWIIECQVLMGPGFYWIWSYVTLSSLGMYGLYSRGEIEDRELHKAFGKEWVEYKKKVPYMFVPRLVWSRWLHTWTSCSYKQSYCIDTPVVRFIDGQMSQVRIESIYISLFIYTRIMISCVC